MVLIAERQFKMYMKPLLFLCFFLPLVSVAQKLKFNAFDNTIKQWRAETFPVSLKALPQIKMDVALRVDTAFKLQLAGSGIGTNTIDVGSRLVLLLANDDTITGVSQNVQPIEYGELTPVYRHEYQFPYQDIQQLAENEIKWIRKYSAGGFDDIKVEAKNAAKLRSQANLVVTELKKANALKPAVEQPGFPGGKQTMLSFLNRNFKAIAGINDGERKTAVIQFQVTEDGSVTDFLINRSAGSSFDNELLRILQRMPKWKPAMQNGKQVSVVVTQPVTIYKEAGALKVEI